MGWRAYIPGFLCVRHLDQDAVYGSECRAYCGRDTASMIHNLKYLEYFWAACNVVPRREQHVGIASSNESPGALPSARRNLILKKIKSHVLLYFFVAWLVSCIVSRRVGSRELGEGSACDRLVIRSSWRPQGFRRSACVRKTCSFLISKARSYTHQRRDLLPTNRPSSVNARPYSCWYVQCVAND